MGKEPINSTFFLYNTVCSITIYDGANQAEEILAEAKTIAFNVRSMLDFYDPESELGKLNQRAKPGIPYRVSRELCRFISALLQFSALSKGCFDPTVGPVVRLWNITALKPKAPSAEEIEWARAKTGAEHVFCDTDSSTITFGREGMMLDAGGAGKGYAADCVAEYLKARGVRSASINFGGNLYLLGPKRISEGGEKPWKVGIQTPWKPGPESIGSLTLQDSAVATSGGYDRYFFEDKKVYHHLLDPRSGYPADCSLDSVTIAAKHALDTDLLSTACFVGGEQMAAKLCRQAGAGYVFIGKDGEVSVSACLKQRFKRK